MKRSMMILAFLAAACDGPSAATPEPVRMTEEALGHFCMMQVQNHSGPKAQIHLEGMPHPVFFAQVRDAVAYIKMQERTAAIAAFYVSDMASAKSWDDPGIDNWINADRAIFVVGADVTGGMGAPEIVPFSTEQAAADFVEKSGGRVAKLQDIPNDAVLGAVDLPVEKEAVQ